MGASSAKRAPGPGQVRVAGSEDARALLERLVRLLGQHRSDLTVVVRGGGTRAAVKALLAGKIDVAVVAGPPWRAEQREIRKQKRKLRVAPVAVDRVAVFVHAGNPIDRLSLPRLQRIFTGAVSGWRQLRGPNYPIVPYNLRPAATSGALFRRRVHGGRKFGATVRRIDDPATILESVRRTPGGISFLSLARIAAAGIKFDGLKVIALSARDGAKAYSPFDVSAARQGSYPVSQPIFLLAAADAPKSTRAFLDFVSGRDGLRISAALGLAPVGKAALARAQRQWNGLR